MQRGKIIVYNLLVFFGLLFLVEGGLWLICPNYQHYYRTHPGQPDLETILAKTDTNWLKPHPSLGWVCQQKEKLPFPTPPNEGVAYQINSQGFRNAFDFKDSLPKDKKRILLLGDSFMFGVYLSEKQTIASQLQLAKGEEYLFFNVSVPAWGLDQMYLAYQEYIDLIQPDQVILAFVDDDLMRSLEILFHGCGKKPSLKIEDNRLVANEDNPHFWEYLCWNNQIGNRLLRSYYERRAIELAEFMFSKIIDHEKELGRIPSFIRIPALVDLQDQEARTVFDLREFMQLKKVNYLEWYHTLSGQNFEPYYIPNDGHFTAEGAALIAEQILPWID